MRADQGGKIIRVQAQTSHWGGLATKQAGHDEMQIKLLKKSRRDEDSFEQQRW